MDKSKFIELLDKVGVRPWFKKTIEALYNSIKELKDYINDIIVPIQEKLNNTILYTEQSDISEEKRYNVLTKNLGTGIARIPYELSKDVVIGNQYINDSILKAHCLVYTIYGNMAFYRENFDYNDIIYFSHNSTTTNTFYRVTYTKSTKTLSKQVNVNYVVLQNSIGSATTHSMSQKAITDLYNSLNTNISNNASNINNINTKLSNTVLYTEQEKTISEQITALKNIGLNIIILEDSFTTDKGTLSKDISNADAIILVNAANTDIRNRILIRGNRHLSTYGIFFHNMGSPNEYFRFVYYTNNKSYEFGYAKYLSLTNEIGSSSTVAASQLLISNIYNELKTIYIDYNNYTTTDITYLKNCIDENYRTNIVIKYNNVNYYIVRCTKDNNIYYLYSSVIQNANLSNDIYYSFVINTNNTITVNNVILSNNIFINYNSYTTNDINNIRNSINNNVKSNIIIFYNQRRYLITYSFVESNIYYLVSTSFQDSTNKIPIYYTFIVNSNNTIQVAVNKLTNISQEFGQNTDFTISQSILTNKFIEIEDNFASLTNEISNLTLRVNIVDFDINNNITITGSKLEIIKACHKIIYEISTRESQIFTKAAETNTYIKFVWNTMMKAPDALVFYYKEFIFNKTTNKLYLYVNISQSIKTSGQ